MKRILLLLWIMSLILAAQISNCAPATWYNNAWKYRRTINVDNTANLTDLTSFQVKISLTNANFDFTRPLADGSDLRVTDADGVSLIPYYIQQYDSQTSHTATIWVRVPTIPGAQAKSIYLYYGNSAPATFTLPPTGLFNRPTAPIGHGVAENMVYDAATNKFYVIYCPVVNGVINTVNMSSASSPLGPWTDLGTILPLGPAGSWDANTVYAPHLIQNNGTWFLYYTGGTDIYGDNNALGVATAASVTGPYTRYSGNPLLSASRLPGDWEQSRDAEPYVYYSTIINKWVMLYMGDAGADAVNIERVGYAVANSPTGPWTKFAGNPIIDFSPAPAWDAATVADPFCVELDGTAYIFYTGGATSDQPWEVGFVTTKDYQTFTKQHIVYGRGTTGEWDAANAFRGAISKGALNYAGTWFFPYSNAADWSVATMNAVSTAKGFDPFQVFDYYDDFSGTSVDYNKWGHPAQSGEGGSFSVANNVLTLNSGVGSYETLVGRRSFGAGHTMEVSVRRNNADGTGNHAGEFGFGIEDRTQLLRMYDYNSPYWLFDTTYAPDQSLLALPQSIDTGWHTQRVAFISAGLVKGQSDNSPWQTISTVIPTVSLKPWLFAYAAPGNSTTMNFSSLLVRGYANTDPILSVSAEQLVPQPQPTTAPANVAAAPGATQVSVSWSAVSGISQYVVKRATVHGGPYTTIASNVTTTTYLDTLLTNGVTYYYVVDAANSGGIGPNSSEVAATPFASLQSLALNPTTVTGGTSVQGTLALNSPAPTGGAIVTLMSSNTLAATVPATVTIAAGATSTTFTVTTKTVTANAGVTISAIYAGVTKTAALTVQAPAPPTMQVLFPTADAYVQAGDNANSNFGSQTLLIVKKVTNDSTSVYNRSIYLKFDLTAVTKTPTKALLALTVDSASNPTTSAENVNLYSIAGATWSESTITWNNAPGLNRTNFSSTGAFLTSQSISLAAGTKASFDLSAFIAANLGKVVTLQMIDASPQNVYLTFESREAASNKPTLTLTF